MAILDGMRTQSVILNYRTQYYFVGGTVTLNSAK